MKIRSAEFVSSAEWPRDWPPTALPEIAFAGRSNVGKSSLINSLCSRRSLVKTSGKPGRTRTINFFRVNDAVMFVDLPGYGYAAVSKTERAAWGRMIDAYLGGRETLLGVVCIADLRRGFEEDDMMLVKAAPEFGVQPILVVTKADKLKTNARANAQRKLAKDLGCKPSDLILYSSTEGWGRDELWDRIAQLGGLPGDDGDS